MEKVCCESPVPVTAWRSISQPCPLSSCHEISSVIWSVVKLVCMLLPITSRTPEGFFKRAGDWSLSMIAVSTSIWFCPR